MQLNFYMYLSTTEYRPRLNTVYLCFASSHGRSVCHEGKMTVCLRFPCIRQWLLHHLSSSVEGTETSF